MMNHFYDDDREKLTAAEIRQIKQDWAELERMLANQDQTLAKMAQNYEKRQRDNLTPQQKLANKEAKLQELYRKEQDLYEKEDELSFKLRKLEEKREIFEESFSWISHLLEAFNYHYTTIAPFAQWQYEFLVQQNGVRFLFDEDEDLLKKQKRQVIDDQDDTYYERIRLASEIEDEKERRKQ